MTNKEKYRKIKEKHNNTYQKSWKIKKTDEKNKKNMKIINTIVNLMTNNEK